MRNTSLMILTFAVGALLSACGGGSSAPANQQPGNQTSLSGQFQIDNGVRGTSSLSGLNGAVSVISMDSGELQATTQTNANGQFTLTDIAPGESLLKLEFDSDYSLGQDGSNQVEVLVPVTVINGVNNSLEGSVRFNDLNNDGTPDGFQIDTTTNNETDSRLVEPVDGFVRIDEDGDGDCMDEDKLRDLDGDGLPEDAHGRDHSLRGGVLKGPIESIDDTTIVVNGVLFNISDATRFKDHGNRQPDMELFQEGTNVHIRGVFNGTEWTALEVKTSGVRDKGEGDDDSMGDDDGDDGDDDGDDDGTDGDDDGTGDDGEGDDGGDDML